VQGLVDALCERPADAFHLGQLVDGRRLNFAQPAEMREDARALARRAR
jgi:hypothetical protein